MAEPFLAPTTKGLKRAGKLLQSLTGFVILSKGPVKNTRQEANSICAHVLRNTYLEDLHASGNIDQDQMKQLMIEASASLEAWLIMRDFLIGECPELYRIITGANLNAYASNWELTGDTVSAKTGKAISRKTNEGLELSVDLIRQLLDMPCSVDGKTFRDAIVESDRTLNGKTANHY